MKSLILSLLIPLFLGFAPSLTAEESLLKEFPELQMVELTLKNGMKVVIKHTDDDSETCVRIVALGGYASSKPSERLSGQLAGFLVMESGIGDLCADKLSAFLYDHSIDFNLKIEPFTRSLDASFPEESLEPFFALVNHTFTKPHFEKDVFINILKQKKS